MQDFLTQLSVPFDWLLRSTVAVSFLVCLILIVKALLRGRLPVRWHYWLWALLLIRIVMPYGLQSSVSIFNLMHLSPKQAFVNETESTASGDAIKTEQKQIVYPSLAEQVTKYVETRKNQAEITAQKTLTRQQIKAAGIAMLPPVWLAGAIVMVIYVCAGNFRLWWIVKRERPLTQQRILDLLEDCKEQLAIHTILGVVVTDRVKSPALFGFIRPRLLLPKGIIESLGIEQLRHIFLHELAHLKRHDIGFGWLMALCQAIHWFNPLVWYGFYRMRLDRELACDALVLSHTQPDESPQYGQTIINLLELFVQRRRLPSLAGVLEDKSQLKRRIEMIAQTKKNSYQWSNIAVVLIILLGCVTLTDARSEEKEQPQDFVILTEQDLPETSYIDENGCIVDKTDYSFEDDPEVIGGWRAVDFVREIDDFEPGVKRWKSDLFLKELFFLEGGRSNWAFTWTKGLIIHTGDKIACEYYIEEIDGSTYMFFEWKSGDYTIRHRRPSYYVLEKDDRLVYVESRTTDKMDYPFVDDPEVIGIWRSVDFVSSIERFKAGEKQWKGRGGVLFLDTMIFRTNGELDCVLNKDNGPIKCTDKWTKGLVLDHSTNTASRYTIEEIDGSAYLFYEWKSGDYTMRRQDPSYYVLKFETADIGESAQAEAPQASDEKAAGSSGIQKPAETASTKPSDEQFRAAFPEKIQQLDIDTATLDKVIEIFGEPTQYVWGDKTFTKDSLPVNYILIYPDGFNVFMQGNSIVELRYFNPGYPVHSVEVGSSLENVLEAVGQPAETVAGQPNGWKDGVLYKDIDGRKGFCYYHRADKSVRFFFLDYKVKALFETRSDYGQGG
jgi:bla regulator protein BlaR1